MADPKPKKIQLGVGLDVGTMNLVAARKEDKVVTKRMRDVFLDLPPNAKKMLKMGGTSFVEKDGDILILGDAAMEIANVFGREARRPLSAGLISAGEVDSLEVLGLLIKEVLGPPREPNEICYYSVPSAPVDDPSRDVVYHTGVFKRIISECGYDPIAANEAMAIIYAETAKDGFSGLGLSFGSGMVNVALAINTIEAMTFSVAQGGDWIDRGAAQSVGSTQARICAIKEAGVDLNNPQGREQEAIAFYYESLIEYVLNHISRQFQMHQGQFSLPRPIPLIISGGTSKAGGFLEFFKSRFEKIRRRFPIEISEIRQAEDPLNAVAHGMLIQAMQEYGDD